MLAPSCTAEQTFLVYTAAQCAYKFALTLYFTQRLLLGTYNIKCAKLTTCFKWVIESVNPEFAFWKTTSCNKKPEFFRVRVIFWVIMLKRKKYPTKSRSLNQCILFKIDWSDCHKILLEFVIFLDLKPNVVTCERIFFGKLQRDLRYWWISSFDMHLYCRCWILNLMVGKFMNILCEVYPCAKYFHVDNMLNFASYKFPLIRIFGLNGLKHVWLCAKHIDVLRKFDNFILVPVVQLTV